MYYFNILGEVTFTSQQPDAFSSGMQPRTPPEVVWAIKFTSDSKEGIYTWSFHDPIRENNQFSTSPFLCSTGEIKYSGFL